MLIGLLALVAGLALFVWGAELFTDGAIHVAARLAMSTFFVGAVVSGFEPENLASGAAAALGGLPQIALGTVIGSTIFLLTAALGLALLVAPMDVRIPREGPVAMVLSVGLFALVLWNDGTVSRLEGALLVVAARDHLRHHDVTEKPRPSQRCVHSRVMALPLPLIKLVAR